MPTLLENNLAALLLKNEELFAAYEEWAKAPAIAYPTVADVQAATVPVAIATLRTNGRTVPGDLGGADWKRVTSEPSHPGKMQSLGGVWWELAVASARVEMFGSINDAATWSGYFGRPVLMTATAVYTLSQQLVMPEGAQLINLQGLYNFVTRTIPVGSGGPRQKGLACIRVAAGLAADAIVFGVSSFNARITGAWIDCRNQASGRGVVWKGDGSEPRTQGTLDHCWVQGAYGDNVDVEQQAHEATLRYVFSSDSRNGSGFKFSGGDIQADMVAAAYNAKYGTHFLNTGGRFRGTGVEAWENAQCNHVFEGTVNGVSITRMVSDGAGQHGVMVKAVNGANLPNDITIMGLYVGTSARLSPGGYDDLYFDYPATFVGPGSFRVIGGKLTGTNSRWRVNGSWAHGNTYGALNFPPQIDIALDSGAQQGVVSPAARRACIIRGTEYSNDTFRAYSTVGSATGFANLLPNGNGEQLIGTLVADVTPAGTATIAQTTNSSFTMGLGTAIAITGGAGVGDGADLFLLNARRYRGKTMTFTGAVLNPAGEPTGTNTRAQIKVNGSQLAGAEQIILSKAGHQFFHITADIPADADSIACNITPAFSAAANGRTVYANRLAFYEGGYSDQPLPAHPRANDSWADIAVTPFSGDLAAIDLRFGARRMRLSGASAYKLVGFSNVNTSEELTVKFMDGNATLVTYSNIRRADGETADYKIPAGAVLRFVFDGTNWIADGGGLRALTKSATANTNANYTLIYAVDAPVHRNGATLTADRTITLSTTNVVDGAWFRVLRTGGGNFILNVGGLTSLKPNDWCDVRYSATAGVWQLEASGSILGRDRVTTRSNTSGSVTLTVSDTRVQHFNQTITSNMDVNLPTTGVYDGLEFVIQKAGPNGAGYLRVVDGLSGKTIIIAASNRGTLVYRAVGSGEWVPISLVTYPG